MNEIDINIKKYQRYFIRYLFKNKLVIDKHGAINKLLTNFGDKIKIKLNDNDINYEKSQSIDIGIKNSLEDLLKYINKEIPNFIYKIYDIEYDYSNNKNKKAISQRRKEKIIFFGTKNMFENLNNIDVKQYFLDITYKIIPQKFKPYKMLTIKGFNTNTKQSVLCTLVCIKYEDEISIYYSMKYLHDFYHFNPEIINIDYSLALWNGLNNKQLFDKNPIVIKCFFHFSQALTKKIKSLKFPKNYNSSIYMIKKNIQIICFLKKSLVNKYMDFLKNYLNENEKEISLYNYINNYWIKKRGIDSINYYDFINRFKNEEGLKYIFITNNIIESFHAKLAKNLPKSKTTEKTFILAMIKILNDTNLNKIDIKRHDYQTRAIIKFADTFNISEKFEWITYNDFKITLKNIISKNENIVNEINIDNYIKNHIIDIDNIYYVNSYDNEFEKNNNNEIIDNMEKDSDKESSYEEESGNDQNFEAENILQMEPKNDNISVEKNEKIILKSLNLIKCFEETNSIESDFSKKFENRIDINNERKNIPSVSSLIAPKRKKRNYNESIKDLNKAQRISNIKKLLKLE